ncbi:MAG TPA: response regulator [Candidatus Binatia bacterium]|nr:response regulator [Candidatus Binatia bacterium]
MASIRKAVAVKGTRTAPWVLVVDDDAELRETLRRMLESIGYRATCVADANAAMSAIDETKPDIVITDIYMPAGDGFELLNWMRRQEIAVPVIAISGSSRTLSDRSRYDPLQMAQELGAVAVLDKPFRQSQLAETIDRVLANRGVPPRG